MSPEHTSGELEVLRQVLAASRDVICLVDAEDGTTLYSSPSCLELIGYAVEEVVGRSAYAYVHEDDVTAVQEAMVRLVKSAQPLTLQFRMLHRGGAHVWVEASAQPPAAGSTRFAVGLRDVTERRELDELLRVAALKDPVTGLANRRLLDDELEAAVARAERTGGSLAVVVIDLDEFKQINDRHGHSVGDEVLRATGARLAAAIRAGDVAGRFGGDEFLALLFDADAQEADALVERLEQALLAPVATAIGPLPVRASVGLAHLQQDQQPLELLNAADRAMYAAKRHRRRT